MNDYIFRRGRDAFHDGRNDNVTRCVSTRVFVRSFIISQCCGAQWKEQGPGAGLPPSFIADRIRSIK